MAYPTTYSVSSSIQTLMIINPTNGFKVTRYTSRGGKNWETTFNPIPLRTAKTLWSFGCSEWNRVKGRNTLKCLSIGTPNTTTTVLAVLGGIGLKGGIP